MRSTEWLPASCLLLTALRSVWAGVTPRAAIGDRGRSEENMRYFFIATIPLLVSCEKQLQHSYDKAMESSAEEKMRALHKSSHVSNYSALLDGFVTESITAELANRIENSLVKFAETDAYPEGFEHIEEVSFTWLNIAGIHTRRAEFGDIFFFPRLDVAEEDRSWVSGVALKRGSNIAYRWKLEENKSEQDARGNRR